MRSCHLSCSVMGIAQIWPGLCKLHLQMESFVGRSGLRGISLLNLDCTDTQIRLTELQMMAIESDVDKCMRIAGVRTC